MWTTTSPDGVTLYSGANEDEARRAAREHAEVGWIGRDTVVTRDGVREGAYRSTPDGFLELN